MVFRKSGVAPITEVRCSCGHVFVAGEHECSNCKKDAIPEELKTQEKDLKNTEVDPEAESKVK